MALSPLRLRDLVADVAPGVDAVADRLAAPYARLAAPTHPAATAGERVTAIASR